MRVLIVEDNPMNLELFRDLLEVDGHVVESAMSCAAARAQLEGAPPDVVLMDIVLPDGDGMGLLADLRRVPAFADVPVMALTAQALRGDAERFLLAGFNRVMTKPIDTRTFVSQIVALVTHGRAP